MEGEPAFPGPFGRLFACIYFDTAKISCLLRDKVTPQKATWTAANALPADSGHVITQHSLANSGTHPQHTVLAEPCNADLAHIKHFTLHEVGANCKNWENGRKV